MNYTFRYEERDGIRLVPLKGEFDIAVAPALDEFIATVRKGTKPVVIDLSETAYIDSTILTVFVRHKRTPGAHFAIVVPKSAKMRRLFEITSLDVGLRVAETISEAVVRLGAATIAKRAAT